MNPSFSETSMMTTVASLLTPRGRGAVATIAVRGSLEQLADLAKQSPNAFFQARNQKPIHQQTIGKILFGKWGEEELIICRTAEEEFEIHCHGGKAAILRILTDLEKFNVSILDPEDFLSRSSNVWEADYEKAVASAKTFRAAEFLLHQRQLGTSLWKELEQLQDKKKWSRLDKGKQQVYRVMIQSMQQWARFGKHLTTPWNIVVGGLANVGKSSLINAILGYERAIVVDQPGTTRDVVTGETAIDGWSILLSDTAGQRKTSDVLEAAGIERAILAMQEADLNILLLDRSSPPSKQDQLLISTFPEALLVFNKTDLEEDPGWQKMTLPQKPLAISCQSKQGIEWLIKTVMQKLIPEIPQKDVIFPVTQKQRQLINHLAKVNF